MLRIRKTRSSLIQTILSAMESHHVSLSARGLYRRWGLAPRPEVAWYSIRCEYSTGLRACQQSVKENLKHAHSAFGANIQDMAGTGTKDRFQLFNEAREQIIRYKVERRSREPSPVHAAGAAAAQRFLRQRQGDGQGLISPFPTLTHGQR